MDQVLQQQIEAAIKQSLPGQVGEALQRELEDLKALRALTAKQAATIKDQGETVERQRDRINQIEAKVAKHEAREAELMKREIEVGKREASMALLELRVEMHKEARLEMRDVVMTAFRGPVLERTTKGHMPVALPGVPASGSPPPYQGAVLPSVASGSFNVTETTTGQG